MAESVVINGTTYPEVEAVALGNGNGEKTLYYPDAVRYHAQTLTEEQKAQARENIGATSKDDIWTEAYQEAIIQGVVEALGTPVFGRVDAENNITLSGALPYGTYKVKYEDAEGNVTEIGSIVTGATVGDIPLAWRRNVNIDGTTGVESAHNTMSSTQMIPLQDGITYTVTVTRRQWGKVHSYWYASDGSFLGRLEHQYDMGAPSSSDLHIPAGGSTVLSPIAGSASFKLRFNHSSTIDEEAMVLDLNYIKLTASR